MLIYFLNEENQSIKDVPIHIDKDTIENQSVVLSANKEYKPRTLKGGRRAKACLTKPIMIETERTILTMDMVEDI